MVMTIKELLKPKYDKLFRQTSHGRSRFEWAFDKSDEPISLIKKRYPKELRKELAR